MAESVIEVSERFVSISASAQIKQGVGKLMGILVTASSGATVKVWGNTTATAPVIADTFTVVAGTFYPIPCMFSSGLFVTITGTGTLTVFYE